MTEQGAALLAVGSFAVGYLMATVSAVRSMQVVARRERARWRD